MTWADIAAAMGSALPTGREQQLRVACCLCAVDQESSFARSCHSRLEPRRSGRELDSVAAGAPRRCCGPVAGLINGRASPMDTRLFL